MVIVLPTFLANTCSNVHYISFPMCLAFVSSYLMLFEVLCTEIFFLYSIVNLSAQIVPACDCRGDALRTKVEVKEIQLKGFEGIQAVGVALLNGHNLNFCFIHFVPSRHGRPMTCGLWVPRSSCFQGSWEARPELGHEWGISCRNGRREDSDVSFHQKLNGTLPTNLEVSCWSY